MSCEKLRHEQADSPVQASATLVVVECVASDVAVWQSRLEARALIEADTNKLHKPNSWADLQALLERYGRQPNTNLRLHALRHVRESRW